METPGCCPLPASFVGQSATYRYRMLDPFLVSCGEPPVISAGSLMAHMLSSTPLQDSFSKQMAAKELMLWQGSGGYYDSSGTRYLALDNGFADAVRQHNYDGMGGIASAMGILVAMASALNRVLILPVVLTKMAQIRYPFQYMNLRKLRHVQWRESSFLSNSKTKGLFGVGDLHGPSRLSVLSTNNAFVVSYDWLRPSTLNRTSVIRRRQVCATKQAIPKMNWCLALWNAVRKMPEDIRASRLLLVNLEFAMDSNFRYEGTDDCASMLGWVMDSEWCRFDDSCVKVDCLSYTTRSPASNCNGEGILDVYDYDEVEP